MPLVTWGAFVPDVFSPAEILDIIIPRQTFDPSHNLSVVLKIIVGRMVENQIISGGNIANFKAVGNGSVVIVRYSQAVEVATLVAV